MPDTPVGRPRARRRSRRHRPSWTEHARAHEVTADRLALPDPRLRSERGRRASVRQTRARQHTAAGIRLTPRTRTPAAVSRCRHSTRRRRPAPDARAARHERANGRTAFGASPPKERGGQQVRWEGAEGGKWVGRPWHLHGRSPRGLADSGRQVKAKGGLDPPTTARQDRGLPDRGDASSSARGMGAAPAIWITCPGSVLKFRRATG